LSDAIQATADRHALARWWDRASKIDPRYLIAFLITLVMVAAQLRYHMLGSYDRLVLALGVCVATEALLSWFERGKVVNLLSAYISGISLTLLIKPQGAALWPFALGGFLAISSKYVLRYRDNHLWNPTNFAVAALFGIFLNQVSYVYAIKFTNASTTALILGSTPIFAALIAYAIGLERMSSRFWVATFVSFGGVGLVAIGSGQVRGDIKGDLLGVATAATWAAYSVAIAPLMRRYSPYRISAIVLVIGWIAVAATGSHQLATQSFHLRWEVWALLAFAVLGPLVLTNILWFKALDRVGPSHATLFANAQPFVAVIFAVLLLGESLSWLQIAGGVAIGVGIWLARRRREELVPGGE
jgi:drug/metabolite transporter (DMT)-like permease